MSANLRLDQLIHELFVLPSDSDYLIARFSALNGLYSPFFWAALQTIEKLIKANLLHKGCPVKKFGHDLIKLSAELKKHDPDILDFELTPNDRHLEIFKISDWGSKSVDEFISLINQNGNPGSRYNYYGYVYDSSYLLKLDQTVHRLRRQATGLDVFDDIRTNDEVKYYAFEDNTPFASPDYEHASIWGKFSSGASVPAIECALKGLYDHANQYESWLLKNIKISGEEISIIKNR